MALSIPGSGLLTPVLNVIAQSLLLPVMIILIIFILIVLLEIGGLIAEYSSRNPLKEDELDKLINDISNSKNSEEIVDLINSTITSKVQRETLLNITSKEHLGKDTRDAYVRKILESSEFTYARKLRLTDIISKVGPGCGLLGTLIPLGPGLSALGTGDIAILSSQLIIAFNTTTVGLSMGLISNIISKIRRSWYENETSETYVLAEAIVEAQNDQKREK